MRPQNNVAIRRSHTTDDVLSPAAKDLHLNIAAEFFHLLRNVFCGRSSPWRTRITTLTRRIAQPCHMRLETIDRNGGDGKQAAYSDKRKQDRVSSSLHVL